MEKTEDRREERRRRVVDYWEGRLRTAITGKDRASATFWRTCKLIELDNPGRDKHEPFVERLVEYLNAFDTKG